VLRSLDLDYSVDQSQSTDTTQDSFIAVLDPTKREFDLPNDCREVRSIECTTGGYEGIVFEFRQLSDMTFQQMRRDASVAGAGSGNGNVWANGGKTYFTTFGANTLMFAAYPVAAITLRIWYVKATSDLTADTPLVDVLYPFSRKVVDYAVQKAMLSVRQETLSQGWMIEWKDGVKTIATTAGPRVSTNPIFIQESWG
jgi:hypothetical protein